MSEAVDLPVNLALTLRIEDKGDDKLAVYSHEESGFECSLLIDGREWFGEVPPPLKFSAILQFKRHLALKSGIDPADQSAISQWLQKPLHIEIQTKD